MKKFLSVLLAALVVISLFTTALASVKTTGNVWMRKGPGLGYGKIRSIKSGRTLEYTGKSSVDSRGVRWYRVRYKGSTGWVSSRYAKLSGSSKSSSSSSSSSGSSSKSKSSTATPAPEITPVPTDEILNVEATPLTDAAAVETTNENGEQVLDVPTFGAPEAVELSPWYLADLTSTASALALGDPVTDETAEFKNTYSNEVLRVAGDTTAQYFRVTGEGYSVYGVSVGDDMDTAVATLTAAGLARTDNILGASFQHYATADSPVNVQGFDSFINVIADVDNKVAEISWSVYTGDWTEN